MALPLKVQITSPLTGFNAHRYIIMTKKHIHKILATITVTAAAVALSSAALAGNKNPFLPVNQGGNQSNNNSQVVAAIHAFSNKFQSWAKSVNNAAYAIDQSLPSLMQVNTGNSAATKVLKKKVYDANQNNIKNSLSQISDSTLTYSFPTQPVAAAALRRINKDSHRINNLTKKLPASDTLYSAVLGVGTRSYLRGGSALAKPKTNNDNYFDMSTLLAPNAYTPKQQKAASGFITFLTKDYTPYTQGIDFNTLRSALNNYKNKPSVIAAKLNELMNSHQFKTYQLNVRSAIAARSVGLNNMNYLLQERSPIKTESPNARLAEVSKTVLGASYKPCYKGPCTYASPLQVSNYIADHRVDSPAWYERMKTASPATVQRETLFVLAEIENQNQQAHLDRERMLATLSAMQLQSAASSQMLMRVKATDLNKEIKDIASSLRK